ncbi:MAG: asparagine synthase [Bacteroidales bacterium]|nr:asparagine synthase [Bacteroidales bacterium]
MAGIAGLTRENAQAEVEEMLNRISHRGCARRKIIVAEGTTMGVCWNESPFLPFSDSDEMNFVRDVAGPGHHATATARNGAFIFSRDDLGVAPLYTGSGTDGTTGFASEVKALIPEMTGIKEVMPGYDIDMTGDALRPGDENIEEPPSVTTDAEVIQQEAPPPDMLAAQLRRLLDDAVSLSIRTEETGSWLSGGLDSAAITALASQYIGGIKTFTAGLEGAPDLQYASQLARLLGTEHHEIVVTVDDLVEILPDVIWHLESFDQLLVRSSLLNFLAAREAAGHVTDIFSGEGADELFAGYTYLSDISGELLHNELLRLTGKLHNTALQRVDRCASAYGMTPRLVFTQPGVKDFALSVSPEYKIFRGESKWILRKALEGLLPPEITWRPKAKFWEGGGVNAQLSEIAENNITDRDYVREKSLPNGWILSGKEELLYYRIFRELFGDQISLSWMGRTDMTHPAD